MTTRCVRVAVSAAGIPFLLAMAAGCASVPRLKAGVVGLPPATPPGDQVWSLPNALTLPQIDSSRPRPIYRIMALDEVEVQVLGHADLGSQLPGPGNNRISVVGTDGTIVLPFVGHVPVVGKTIAEIGELLHASYAEVVENPEVEVRLERCRSQGVEVNGQVAHPGTYYLCNDVRTLGDLLGAAGGVIQGDVDLERATLSRQNEIYRLDLLAAYQGRTSGTSIIIEERDRLYVPSSHEHLVYVFGEVLHPGAYPIPSGGLSFMDALMAAGGHNPVTARVKRIFLARLSGKDPMVYQVKLADLIQSPEIKLADGDRIFVPPSSVTRWGRWWRQALPFGSIDRAIGAPGG